MNYSKNLLMRLYTMNSEIGYGIFVIKPDGYRKKYMKNYINSRGFQIIKKLTINDVKIIFLCHLTRI